MTDGSKFKYEFAFKGWRGIVLTNDTHINKTL